MSTVEKEKKERARRTGLLEFVKAWQTSNNIEEVAEKLTVEGEKAPELSSLQTKASKLRQPEYVMVPKVDDAGEEVKNEKGETVMVPKVDDEGNPVVKRKAIPLKHFERATSARRDEEVDEALEFIESLSGE